MTLFSVTNDKEVQIAELAFSNMLKNYPEFFKNLSKDGVEKCRTDILYHTMFLLQSISLNSPSLFSDYVRWAKELFFSIGVSVDAFYKSLFEIVNSIQALVGDEYAKMGKYYVEHALKTSYSSPEEIIKEKDNQKVLETEIHSYRKMYINYVLSLHKKDAHDLIFSLLRKGISIKDIYLKIFRDALYEVGLLWQIGKISVAQEHYFTALTQLIMSELYPYIFNEQKSGKVVVGACVSGELHEIGLRMVCDILEMEGFDTHFLGANTPLKDIIKFSCENNASFIMFSVTLLTHIDILKEYIKEVRRDERLQGIKIVVGGRPFLVDRELYKTIGADYSTPDLDDLINYLKSS